MSITPGQMSSARPGSEMLDANGSTSARRCRLLYLVGQLGPGGLERQLYLLLKSIDRKRYRPAITVWSYCEDEVFVSQVKALGIPVYGFTKGHSRAAKLTALSRLVEQLKPELVHSYSFHTNFAAWCATVRTKTIAIGAVRSDFTNDKRSCGLLLGNLCARWPQKQIYNNFAGAKTARNSHTLFAPGEIFVVRNGLDLELFPKVPLPLNGDAHILGIGSLLEYKRWDRLLTAALELKQRGLSFRIEIAGGGPLRESLERQARDLGLTERVNFIGHTNDVSGLLAKSTFLAHTSNVEGCPNVVMEAMACGRAVVATDAGDIPSLVEGGKTGFVIRRGDDTKLVDCLATLIRDRDLCQKMGEAGRDKAEREFGLNRLVDETLATYRASGWRDS